MKKNKCLLNCLLLLGVILFLNACSKQEANTQTETHPMSEENANREPPLNYSEFEFDQLIDTHFSEGLTTYELVNDADQKLVYSGMKLKATVFDKLIRLNDTQRLDLLRRYDAWDAIDTQRNKRDEHREGSGAALFTLNMMRDRIDKFAAYLENREVMDEILTFSVRYLGKEWKIINGELDIVVEREGKTCVEPYSQIDCTSATKKIIGNTIYHAAVFYPDSLLVHQNEHGDCLVVWENGKHIASFPREDDFCVQEIQILEDKTIRLIENGENEKSFMKFDFNEPNYLELHLDHWSLY